MITAICQFLAQHWYVSVPLLGVLCLAAVNYDVLAAKIRKPKPRSIPARNIVDLTAALYVEACKLPSVERDATNQLIDKIKHISEQSLIDPLHTDDPIVTAAKNLGY